MHSSKKIIKYTGGKVLKSLLTLYNFMEHNIILTYHRVVESIPEGLHDPAMFVTAATLDMHIAEIKKQFNIVSLNRMISSYKEEKKLCAITFDDGWRDNYIYAFPVLKKHNVPATIFIPVNVLAERKNYWFQDIWHIASLAHAKKQDMKFINYIVDTVHSWTPHTLGITEICNLIHELKEYPVELVENLLYRLQTNLGLDVKDREDTLELAEMREMGEHGITFGSHGLNHRILTRIGREMKESEVTESLLKLKSLNIPTTDVFCYPNGDWDIEVISCLKMAGYKGAVTTALGYNRNTTDPYLLHRIGIHEEIANSSSLLWFRLCQAIGSGTS